MLNIRKVEQDDMQKIYFLISELAKHQDLMDFVLTDEYELTKSGTGSKPKFEVLLAEYNGQAAGFLSYTWNYSIWLGKTYMNLDDLFVLEDFRGRKFGEKLMQHARQICENKDVDTIRWEVESENTQAIRFYNSLGASLHTKGVYKWKLNQ